MTYPNPGEMPEWDANDTNTTLPTSELADGWDPAALPRADYDNWYKRFASRLLRHLDFSRVFASDLGPDQALSDYGSAPSTGSGLGPVSAGDFAARVWADGKAAGQTNGPAHTYADDADTYWDLSRDGTWTAAAVASGDPEPSVTSNSVRVYRVRTASGDRTEVEDRRGTRLKVSRALDILKGLRLGDSLRSSAADFLIARLSAQLSTSSSQRMLLAEFTAGNYPTAVSGGNKGVRLYMAGAGSPYFELVIGAAWNSSTSQWDADPTSSTILMKRHQLTTQGIVTQVVSDSLVGSSFADSEWSADHLPSQTKALDFYSSVRAGDGNWSNREAVEVPCFDSYCPNTSVPGFASKAGESARVYALPGSSPGLGGAGRGQESAFNAKRAWNGSAFEWQRVNTGVDSYLVQAASQGVKVFRRASSLSDTWTHTVHASNGWTLLDEVGQSTKTLYQPFGPGVVLAPFGHADLDLDSQSGGTLANIPKGVRKFGGSTDGDVLQPLSLPHGAVIQSAEISFLSSGGSSSTYDCRIALVRLDTSANWTSLDAASYKNVPNNGSPFDISLTVDQNLTVDAENYRYFAWVQGAVAVGFIVLAASVTYEIAGSLAAWRG